MKKQKPPPVCAYGQRTDTPTGRAPGYDGLDHCPACCADTERICASVNAESTSGSHLHTDEAPAYADLDGLFYRHDAINHGLRQYRRKEVTTNSIESAFAVLKRGIIGVYHHITPKHTGRYVDEFAFRLNDGNVKRPTFDRLDSFVDGMAGKWLSYADLIAKPEAN